MFMTLKLSVTVRVPTSLPILTHESRKVKDPLRPESSSSSSPTSRSNTWDDPDLIEKTKKQRTKIDSVRKPVAVPFSSKSPIDSKEILTKKRKIGVSYQVSEAREDCPGRGKELSGDSPSYKHKRWHSATETEFFRSQRGGQKSTRLGEDMEYLEKPKHVFTVQNRKEAPYLELIRNGTKKAECRVNTPAFGKIQVGDPIQFHNRHQGILCRVTYLHTYKNFREMVIGEGVKNILPHIYDDKLDTGKLIEKAVKVYEDFPGSHRVQAYGSIAIGVIYLRDYFRGR
ncbi:MAG: hypothetical protein C5B45_01380 [Chlamydiae bacterium]|nr:MAG: hypothetical protein C5B45_01380 [Chlamydiota bacterium]